MQEAIEKFVASLIDTYFLFLFGLLNFYFVIYHKVLIMGNCYHRLFKSMSSLFMTIRDLFEEFLSDFRDNFGFVFENLILYYADVIGEFCFINY